MIIDYDHNPSATEEQKLQSFKESIQMALNEIADALADLKREIKQIKEDMGE